MVYIFVKTQKIYSEKNMHFMVCFANYILINLIYLKNQPSSPGLLLS